MPRKNFEIIDDIRKNGFPEEKSKPVDEIEFLTEEQKDFFHKTYEAHHFFCENKYNNYANDYFKIAQAYFYICILNENLVRVPFIQKYALFYGVIPDKLGLCHLFNRGYECSMCGRIFSKHELCPYCK